VGHRRISRTLPALLDPASWQRDLALALIASRVVRPGTKLSTLSWWSDTTLGVDLGVAYASTDEVYAAMDWLLSRQSRRRVRVTGRSLGHLRGGQPVVPRQVAGDAKVSRRPHDLGYPVAGDHGHHLFSEDCRPSCVQDDPTRVSISTTAR
jgi:hypothetical protein